MIEKLRMLIIAINNGIVDVLILKILVKKYWNLVFLVL